MTQEMMDQAVFWAYAVWTFAIVGFYNSLPGPWWCKVLLIVICVAIPGGFDEIMIVGVATIWRKWRNRK